MRSAAEVTQLLMQKVKEGADTPHVHGVVVDDDDALDYRPGLGLFVEVLAVGGQWDGRRVRAAVSGSLFGASQGNDFWSQPLAAGDHLLVVLVEGHPDGQALATERIGTTDTPPPDKVAGRGVHAVNMRKHYMRRFRSGSSVFLETENGDVFLKMSSAGALTIAFPDGSSLDISPPVDPVKKTDLSATNGAGYQFRFKNSSGTAATIAGRGIELKSPNGGSFILITDAEITLFAPVIRTVGITLLDLRPGEPVPLQGVVIAGPGVPAVNTGSGIVYPTNISKGVFVGLGL